MILDNGKYYLYRHIRLDTNEVFYVGIGTKNITNYIKTKYYRAFDLRNRNKFWKAITAKTEYEVEIMLESDDYEFIKQKEIEFIALYGRRDLDKGTLVNLTDGGDGNNRSTLLLYDVYIKENGFVSQNELVKKSDIIIIASPHKEYKKIKFPKNKIVVDIWNIYGSGCVI